MLNDLATPNEIFGIVFHPREKVGKKSGIF
jgi:hypothetical protein